MLLFKLPLKRTSCLLVDSKISESVLPGGTRQKIFEDALAWAQDEGGSIIVGGSENRVVCFEAYSYSIDLFTLYLA